MKKNINSGQKQGQNNFSTSCRNGKDAGFTHQGNLRSKLIDSILLQLEKLLHLLRCYIKSSCRFYKGGEQADVSEIPLYSQLPQRTLDKMGWDTLDEEQKKEVETFLSMDETETVAPSTLILLSEGCNNENVIATLLRNYEEHVHHPKAAKFIRSKKVLRLFFTLAGMEIREERIRTMQQRLEKEEYRKKGL